MESVTTIFNRHDTDKNVSWHNFSRQYDSLLKPYRERPCLNYLEIGVHKGASLRAMREVFPSARYIVGVDISPDSKIYEDISNGIYIETGDATVQDTIDNITQKYGRFDIILDDGGHYNTEVISTFELLFPLLKEDGVYIVEDTVCSKIPVFQNTDSPNHIDYFSRYIHHLNQCRSCDSVEEPCDYCSDPFKIKKKTNDIFEICIDKIEFGCSYIAVYKKTRFHWY